MTGDPDTLLSFARLGATVTGHLDALPSHEVTVPANMVRCRPPTDAPPGAGAGPGGVPGSAGTPACGEDTGWGSLGHRMRPRRDVRSA